MQRITKSRLLNADGTASDTAVNATANVYTHSHKMAFGSAFCVTMRAKSSTGTPDIDVFIEQTHINPASTAAGAEGEAGDIENGWASPEGSSKVADIVDENWTSFVISPISLPYLRFLLDGQGANPADCTVEIWVSQLEDI